MWCLWVPFLEGNLLYIAASDLVPEVNKHHDFGTNVIYFVAFVAGIVLLFGLKITLEP